MATSDFQKHHIIPQDLFKKFGDFFKSIDILKNEGNLVLLPTKQELADFLKRSPHLGGPLQSYTEPLKEVIESASVLVEELGDQALATKQAIRSTILNLQTEMRSGLTSHNLLGHAIQCDWP